MKNKNYKTYIKFTETKLGSKTEPYYTEKEMLAIKIYSFDTLSKSEKQIYNKLLRNESWTNK
jgi:hypothetical protein